MTGAAPERRVIDRIIACPVGDALRYSPAQGVARRAVGWLGNQIAGGEARARAGLADLARQRRPDLCVIGPGVGPAVAGWLPNDVGHDVLLDLAGHGLGAPVRDPRRRALNETWFTTARSAAELVLEVLAESAPPVWGERIRKHHEALILRLKVDIGLRLRRLEIVADRAAEAGARHMLLIEGDQPLDDLAAHFLARGGSVSIGSGPGARFSSQRRRARALATPAATAANWTAFEAEATRGAPVEPALGGRAVVAADLRRKIDFRHSQTVRALLAETAADGVTLLQPYTRVTRNVVRAMNTVQQLGARIALVRQPQATGTVPGLAGVRSALLQRVDAALSASGAFQPGEQAAILEATGGFVISSLGRSLVLADRLQAGFETSPPRFVASTPLGSPFGALVVSAARMAGVRTVEIQTLMIGKSERDPAPVAERIAVLDTSQRDIFKVRFGVTENRFILAGHVELPGRNDPPIEPVGKTVLFASQPLDGVASAALALLADACSRLGEVQLTVAPHPDETAEDLENFRQVLARWPNLDARVASPGDTLRLLPRHAVLATVLSNVALRAAVAGQPVLVLDPGVETPLDFERLGLACKARTPTHAANLLSDFFSGGPAAEALAASRAAYFQANPQLTRPGAIARIVAGMSDKDQYWRDRPTSG